MTRSTHTPGETWPRLMRAETAAAYVGESSVESFLRAVGSLWPRPIKVPGKGVRYVRDDLDDKIETLRGRRFSKVMDAADVL